MRVLRGWVGVLRGRGVLHAGGTLRHDRHEVKVLACGKPKAQLTSAVLAMGHRHHRPRQECISPHVLPASCRWSGVMTPGPPGVPLLPTMPVCWLSPAMGCPYWVPVLTAHPHGLPAALYPFPGLSPAPPALPHPPHRGLGRSWVRMGARAKHLTGSRGTSRCRWGAEPCES